MALNDEIRYIGNGSQDLEEDAHHDSFLFQKILLGQTDLKLSACLPEVAVRKRERPSDILGRLFSHEGALLPFLRSDRTNVISLEQLTAPYRSTTVPKEMPKRLKHALKGAEVKVLVTLRNQAALMESFWHEKGTGYFYREGLGSPAEFYFKGDKLKESEGVRVFDFLEIVDAYAAEWGDDNVHLCLYEDIISDPKSYFDTIAKALDIESRPSSELKSVFEKGSQYRVASKSNDFLNLRIAINRSRLFAGAPIFVRCLTSSLSINVKAPRFTAKERLEIKNHFRSSNMEICDRFGLNKQAMHSYGYF